MVIDAGAMDVRTKSLTTFVTTADKPELKRFAFWREAVCNTFLGLDCLSTSEQSFFGEIATTRIKDIGFSRSRILSRGLKYMRTPHWVRQDRATGVFISLVLKGTYSITQDGREAQLGPGDFTCLDGTRPYSGSVSDDYEQFILHMPRDAWVSRIGPTEQVTARTVRIKTEMGALASNFLRQVVPYIGTVDSVTADRLAELSLALVTTALGNLILQQEPCQSTARITLLYRAKTFIEQNLRDTDLNPEKVAQALRITERYLRYLFHEESSTVSDWIWNRRLKKSRQDLSDPLLVRKSVSQIAFDCGFSDLSHFGRRFKAAFSLTPSEFRRQQIAGKPQPH